MDELSKTLCSSNYAKDNGVLLYNNDVYIREAGGAPGAGTRVRPDHPGAGSV